MDAKKKRKEKKNSHFIEIGRDKSRLLPLFFLFLFYFFGLGGVWLPSQDDDSLNVFHLLDGTETNLTFKSIGNT